MPYLSECLSILRTALKIETATGIKVKEFANLSHVEKVNFLDFFQKLCNVSSNIMLQ